MVVHFLVFDRVEELDLVGSWELVGLPANPVLCTPLTLATPNSNSGAAMNSLDE